MGRLFLVRHAQASFLSQNYDQLSALGQTQARLLGEYWSQRNVFFDRVCTGPALRHRQTAQLVGEAYRKTGRNYPSPVDKLRRLVARSVDRSEEHTSELQSPYDLVCRLLLEKK